jgi:hypothetical protein
MLLRGLSVCVVGVWATITFGQECPSGVTGAPDIGALPGNTLEVCDHIPPVGSGSDEEQPGGDRWEYSKEYFDYVVGKRTAKEFAEQYIAALRTNPKNAQKLKLSRTIVKAPYTYEVYYQDPTAPDEDLIGRTYTPHAWIRRNAQGEVVDVGNSFVQNVPGTRPFEFLVEQVVFKFKGLHAGKALLENW